MFKSKRQDQSPEPSQEPGQVTPLKGGLVIEPSVPAEPASEVDSTEINQPETSQPVAAAETAPTEEAIPKKRFKFLSKLKPEYIFPAFIRNKFGKHARLAGIIVLLLLVTGIGYAAYFGLASNNKSSQTVFASELAPFSVIKTTPEDNAQNVDDQSTITVKFNRPVDASKLQDDFFVTPRIDGTVKQGTNENEVIFTPKVPFGKGTSVKVMIHGDFLSNTGDKLGSDFFFGFSTVIPSDGVVFSQNGLFTRLTSGKADSDQKFSLEVGNSVKAGGKVTVYKSSADKLLNSFVYDNVDHSDGGGKYKDFVNQAIGTSGLTEVKTFDGLKDGLNIDVQQGVGVYLAVAISGDGKQAGWTWVVFNDNGLLLKQDDQKIILGTQNLTDGSTNSTANVTFYNLDKTVQSIKTASFSGIKEFSTTNEPTTDIVVGTFGSETVIVPVNVLDSLADLRATENYSTTNMYYTLTDRPTYQPKDTVKFAGFARVDNDAQFTSASGQTVKLFVASPVEADKHLVDASAKVGSDGRFSGSFTVGSDFLPADQQNQQLTLYADNGDADPIAVTTFNVTETQLPQYNFKVSFDKSSYLANQSVVAQVTATDAVSGKPVANTTATYNIYSKSFYEDDATSNLASDSYVGSLVGKDQDLTLNLDANGHASVPVDISKLPKGDSQTVTVQVSKKDSKGLAGSGGASSVIHQGNAKLVFGPSRTDFTSNEPFVSRVYATDLTGQPLANKTIKYRFATYTTADSSDNVTEKVLASGSVNTDGNGFAEINKQVSLGSDNTSVTLIVDVQDSNNLTVEAQTYLYVLSADSAIVHSDAALGDLDISGTNGHAKVGDNLNLTVKSPQDMTVLVTYQRGRIYKSEWLKLNKGDNSYSVSVDAKLAPSFTLGFAYFYNGQYFNEGTTFKVDIPSNKGSLTLTTDKSSYKSGDTADIKVAAKDGAGNSISTPMIVGVVSDSIFSLNNNVASDIYLSFFGTRETAINASSSLVGIGTGGGGCGGGGFDGSGFANRPGQLLYWDPSASTNGSGASDIKFSLKKGSWRVYVYSVSDGTIVASSQTTVTAQ